MVAVSHGKRIISLLSVPNVQCGCEPANHHLHLFHFFSIPMQTVPHDAKTIALCLCTMANLGTSYLDNAARYRGGTARGVFTALLQYIQRQQDFQGKKHKINEKAAKDQDDGGLVCPIQIALCWSG